MKQRELMRTLYRKCGDDESALMRGYTAAERKGVVVRQSNAYGISPEQYGCALYHDGIRKGWINEESFK